MSSRIKSSGAARKGGAAALRDELAQQLYLKNPYREVQEGEAAALGGELAPLLRGSRAAGSPTSTIKGGTAKPSAEDLIEAVRRGLTRREIAEELKLSYNNVAIKLRNMRPLLEAEGLEIKRSIPTQSAPIRRRPASRRNKPRKWGSGSSRTERRVEYTVRTGSGLRTETMEIDGLNIAKANAERPEGTVYFRFLETGKAGEQPTQFRYYPNGRIMTMAQILEEFPERVDVVKEMGENGEPRRVRASDGSFAKCDYNDVLLASLEGSVRR